MLKVSWPVSGPPVMGEKLIVRSQIVFRPMVTALEASAETLGQAPVAVVAQVQLGLMEGLVPLAGTGSVMGALPASVAKAVYVVGLVSPVLVWPDQMKLGGSLPRKSRRIWPSAGRCYMRPVRGAAWIRHLPRAHECSHPRGM